MKGKVEWTKFPPMEAARHDRLFVLRENRRLFLLRVLASLGLVQTVRVNYRLRAHGSGSS